MKAGYAEDESPWELHPISIIQKYVLDTYIKYRYKVQISQAWIRRKKCFSWKQSSSHPSKVLIFRSSHIIHIEHKAIVFSNPESVIPL